jgi:hypothetical protein
MKTKRTLTIATVLVALATFTTLGIFRGTRPVHAQDTTPPPVNDRISFGMVGLTQGQTIRLNVVNSLPPPIGDYPPGPTRVVLTFLNAEGNRFRNRDGSFIQRTVQLDPGHATSLDLNVDDIQFLPGPSRLQLRAVVTAVPPPIPDSEQPPPVGERIVPSVEVFTSSNLRTVFYIGNPGVIRGFNPQPDPPLGQ